MKLSKKTDYALRGLMFLIEKMPDRKPTSVRELAMVNDCPQRFLEHIMLEMKRAGWVKSKAGRDGGFLLAISPDDITMGQVIRHFDGVLAPIGCVSSTHYESCSLESRCRFRRIMLDIRNYITSTLDDVTLAQALRNNPVRMQEVFHSEFTYGDGI